MEFPENKNNTKIHKFNVKKIKAKYNKKDKIVNDILEKIKFCQKIFFEVEKYINQLEQPNTTNE